MVFFQDEFFLGWTLRPMQRKIITEFYAKPHREMVGCAGMRGGKTTIGAGCCLYELAKLLVLDDPFKHYHLLKAQPISIIGMSYKEELATDTIYSVWKTSVTSSPFFQEFEPRVLSDAIYFDDQNILMRVGGANTPGLVGHTDKAVLLDEIDKFRDNQGRTSGWLMYSQMTAGTESFGKEGKSFTVSSPIARKGIIMRLLDIAKKSEQMYWFHLPTWEMNPEITRASLQDKFDRDPISAARDYGAEPGPDSRPFFANRAILKINGELPNLFELMEKGVLVLPERHRYVLAADPAKKFDSMGLGIGHMQEGRYIIDGLKRYIPTKSAEINALDVKKDVERIVSVFPVDMYVSDTWHYAELQDSLSRMGIVVENHIVRTADYEELKTTLYEKRMDICNYPFVLTEMEELELLRDKVVDHPKGGSKDVSDCVVNLMWGINKLGTHEYVPLNIVVGFRR